MPSLDDHINSNPENSILDVGANDPEFAAIEARLSLKPLMSSLTPMQKRVIRSRFIDELEMKEVAAMEGISIGYVKSSQSHGMAACRKLANSFTVPESSDTVSFN
jgi:DNA-directed RNA polymerase specialized sigma24 family protein